MKKIISLLAILVIMACITATPIVSFADDFVPSIGYKPVPEVLQEELVAAEIINEKGEIEKVEVFELAVDVKLLRLTSYAEAIDENNESIPNAIKVSLIEAHDELKDVDSKEEYTKLGIDFDELAQKVNPEYDSSVFVVSYLFDITINSAYKEWLVEDETHYCRVKFNLHYDKDGAKPVIMHKLERTGTWALLEDNFIEIDENDGSLILYFKEFCPIAFIEVSEQRVEELFIRRQQKHSFWWILLLLIFIFVLLVFYTYLIYTDKKRNNAKTDNGNAEKLNK